MPLPFQPVAAVLSRDHLRRTFFPRIIGLTSLLLAIGISALQAETPSHAVDRIMNAWLTSEGSFDKVAPEHFRVLSQAVAQEQGTGIIARIMARSKNWKNEEVFVFVAVVAYLPRDQSVPILQRYNVEGDASERQVAFDLLIELDSADVKEMLKWYPRA